LFSATYPDEIRAIAERVMVDPLVVQVASTHDTSSIEQLLYEVDDNAGRTEALKLLLLHYRPDSALVFCNTKRETQAVADELAGFGFVARALHGDLEQRDRDETLVRFANKSTSVLVATDVAARGLDIEAIDTVINYHVPRELEVYIHRIGRTARAGSKGVACTLFTEKETRKIARLEEYLGHALERTALPSATLQAQPAYKPSMVTLQIDGGRKQKLRPGDILGALTGTGGIAGSDVGKIRILDQCAYVAIKRQRVKQAEQTLSSGKMKGRVFRVRQV
jgi:ATP-independent RNA helicase DbpA